MAVLCAVIFQYGLEARQEKVTAVQRSLNIKPINLYFERQADGGKFAQRTFLKQSHVRQRSAGVMIGTAGRFHYAGAHTGSPLRPSGII